MVDGAPLVCRLTRDTPATSCQISRVSFGERRFFLRAAFEQIVRRYELGAQVIERAARQRLMPVGSLMDELRMLLADVTRYARTQVRERYLGGADPVVVMSERLLLDACEAMTEAKKSVAVAIVHEKRLDKQVEQEQANAVEWEGRALRALEAGEEDLAREALAWKEAQLTLVADLRVLWAAQRARVEKQKDALRRMNETIERAKRTKNTLVARRSIVESGRRIDDAVARVERTMRALEMLAQLDEALEQADRAAAATRTPAPDA
jgi:phage shock protein A